MESGRDKEGRGQAITTAVEGEEEGGSSMYSNEGTVAWGLLSEASAEGKTEQET